ncbi:MAG: hypothetical protein GX629_07925 [Phycisphaerae bacterium]|jgi:hypothetical protein|nr:hypothetical protein [Phycisphaerae bacterium]
MKKKLDLKTTVWVLAGVVGVMGAILLSGCSGVGGSSSGVIDRGGERWTVIVKRLNPGQEVYADVVVKSLRQVRGIDAGKIRKQQVGGYTVVMYGQYSSLDDANAQRDMQFIKSLMVPDQGYPFVDAHLEPMPEPDPPIAASWVLEKTKGYWTLQVGQFYGPGRKQGAVEMVKILRNEGVPAYVSHGPVKSLVTIGSYPENAVGTPGKGKISRKLIPRNADLKKWSKQYPYLIVNSEYAKFKSSQGPGNEKVEVRLESQIIKISRPGESLW